MIGSQEDPAGRGCLARCASQNTFEASQHGQWVGVLFVGGRVGRGCDGFAVAESATPVEKTRRVRDSC